jgi:hypothetical protein
MGDSFGVTSTGLFRVDPHPSSGFQRHLPHDLAGPRPRTPPSLAIPARQLVVHRHVSTVLTFGRRIFFFFLQWHLALLGAALYYYAFDSYQSRLRCVRCDFSI